MAQKLDCRGSAYVLSSYPSVTEYKQAAGAVDGWFLVVPYVTSK